MQETEIIKLISVCSANYRGWPEEGKGKVTVELWSTMLGDIPFEVVQAAVKMHLSKSVFPPTVADIRQAAADIMNPSYLTAIEAWDAISRAIRKFGYYREIDGLASLPEEVRQMTERFSWRELCLSENIDTLRAQFRMAWETQQKRNHEQYLYPADVKRIADREVKLIE